MTRKGMWGGMSTWPELSEHDLLLVHIARRHSSFSSPISSHFWARTIHWEGTSQIYSTAPLEKDVSENS